MRGMAINLVTGALVVIVIAVVLFGYFGLIPGVSGIFGPALPQYLQGCPALPDETDIPLRSGIEVQALPAGLPPEQSIQASQQLARINGTFTGEEIAAMLNQDWQFAPVTGLTVRINGETFELSGIIREDRIEDCARALAIPDYTAGAAMNYLTCVRGNPRVYMNCRFEMVNSQIRELEIYEMQIGETALSDMQIERMRAGITNFFQGQLGRLPGTWVKSLAFSGGKLHFDGTVPAVVGFSPPQNNSVGPVNP